MGCVYSIFARREAEKEESSGDYHVVYLTSSTYGVLKLDKEPSERPPDPPISGFDFSSFPRVTLSPKRSDSVPEIINARELMAGLDDDLAPQPSHAYIKSGLVAASKKKKISIAGKELDFVGDKENLQSPPAPKHRTPLSPLDEKAVLRPTKLNIPLMPRSRADLKVQRPVENLTRRLSGSRRSSSSSSSSSSSKSPMFDPELVASFEKELSLEEEARKQETIKRMTTGKCPPGGENGIILYTTTLRGIRKTFDDCNEVRSALEIHQVRIIERDISMDSGFREELRELMGGEDARVPMVFIRGRRIGGAAEVMKLEDDGKLGLLVQGLPRSVSSSCVGCGGLRFVVCMDCSGSTKAMDDERKVGRCGECNENGLIACPICC